MFQRVEIGYAPTFFISDSSISSSRSAEADLPSSMARILKRFHISLSTRMVVL